MLERTRRSASCSPRSPQATPSLTFAFTEDNGAWDSSGVTMTATGNKLNGTKSFVVDGHTADLIVVLARQAGTTGDNGLSLFTVRGDAPG